MAGPIDDLVHPTWVPVLDPVRHTIQHSGRRGFEPHPPHSRCPPHDGRTTPHAHGAHVQSHVSSSRPTLMFVSVATAPSLSSSAADEVVDEVRRTGVG